MNGVEFPASPTFLVEDANKVDHRITALDTCMKLDHIMHVGLNDVRAWQHQQFPGTFTPAGHDPESMTASGELRAQVAADKTGSAQYTDRQGFHAGSPGLTGSRHNQALGQHDTMTGFQAFSDTAR